MQLHLEQIAEATPNGRVALVIMDNAGWHQNGLVDGLNNVVIMKLPPYSPELNSIEQVWSWMRQHALANRSFLNYEEIVEQVSKAWNQFRSNLNRVKMMCNRDWIRLTS